MVTGTVISSTAFNALTADLATGLSTCILKDGTQTLTANIPMAGFVLTGLGSGSAAGQSLRYEQGLQSILTTLGDGVIASAANTPARLAAKADVAAHATTANIWVASQVVLTGAAVTFTDINDAPYVGAVAWVKQQAANIWTDGAVFDVQGGANYTAAANDWVRVYATTVSTFEVTIFRALDRPITLATEQASTSGTSIDFTGIPAGVKRITVMFKGVSTNGTSLPIIQLGDAGGPETTGYLSGSFFSTGDVTSTAGFVIGSTSAANVLDGHMVFSLENASNFTWTGSGAFTASAAGFTNACAGSKSLSAELTQVRITTVNGTDAFDAGAINISYE